MAKKVCIFKLINNINSIKQIKKINEIFRIKFYFVEFIFSLINETSKHNHTFESTNLQMLCNGSQNMKSIEKDLNDSFARFEINKSNFSSNIRRLWRQHFSGLAKECQKQNASQEIVSFAIKLADHAYKLPECM